MTLAVSPLLADFSRPSTEALRGRRPLWPHHLPKHDRPGARGREHLRRLC